jgi:hypothetical protein
VPIVSQVKACPKIQRVQEIGIAFSGFAVIIIKPQHLIWDISNLTAADANKMGNVGERVRASDRTASSLSVSCLRTTFLRMGFVSNFDLPWCEAHRIGRHLSLRSG